MALAWKAPPFQSIWTNLNIRLQLHKAFCREVLGQQKNASILNLVELFQDEKERNMMIQIAEMQKQAVQDEAEKFENMSSWKARILGVSKEDAI